MHREVYGMIIDKLQPDPRKAVSYPQNCDNYDWMPKDKGVWTDIDERWNKIFVFKGIEEYYSLSYDDVYVKVIGDWYSETYEIWITNAPMQGYEKLGQSEYTHIWFHNCLAVMMLQRLDARGMIEKERD